MGWDIVGIDVFDDFYDPVIKRHNIRSCIAHEAFQLHEIDIRRAQDIRQCTTTDIDVIIHLAARAGVRPSIARPELYADVNVNGTLVLLETARQKNIKRFIFASSSSVYGNNTKVPFSEDDNVDSPISPYAATKKAGELLCHTYHHLYGLDITCLRFFTVYGPRQRPDLAIHKFAGLIEANQPITIYGDGTMMRDFTYIDDIIAGVVASIEVCQGYHLYNLGESRPISVNDLVTALEKALGKQALRQYVEEQPGDVKQTYADVRKAVKDLGYSPSTHLEDGLAVFVEWLRHVSR
jgi:UDP-glucuronate 4-epimerase